MALKARFFVESVQDQYGDAREVRMRAVAVGEASANAAWSKRLPSGSILMTITNPEAFGEFTEGQEINVEFSAVEQ